MGWEGGEGDGGKEEKRQQGGILTEGAGGREGKGSAISWLGVSD